MLADDGLCRLACSCGETVRAALMMQDGGTCIPVVNGALEPREDLSRRTGASSGAEGERRVILRASASTLVPLLLTATTASRCHTLKLSTRHFQSPYPHNYHFQL